MFVILSVYAKCLVRAHLPQWTGKWAKILFIEMMSVYINIHLLRGECFNIPHWSRIELLRRQKKGAKKGASYTRLKGAYIVLQYSMLYWRLQGDRPCSCDRFEMTWPLCDIWSWAFLNENVSRTGLVQAPFTGAWKKGGALAPFRRLRAFSHLGALRCQQL